MAVGWCVSQSIEKNCIQDLMYIGIHAQRTGKNSPAEAVHRVCPHVFYLLIIIVIVVCFALLYLCCILLQNKQHITQGIGFK